MSDRLTPFGVIDRYFYSGDDNGGPVLGWGSFHAQRITELLAAEGWAFVRKIAVPADLDDSPELAELPNGSVLFDDDCDVVVKDGESDGEKADGVWRFWGSDPTPNEEEAVICLPALLIHDPRKPR